MRFLRECRPAEYRAIQKSEDEARQLAAILATIVINVKRRIAAENAARRDRE